MVQNVSTVASNGSIASNVHLEWSCTVKDLALGKKTDNLPPYEKFHLRKLTASSPVVFFYIINTITVHTFIRMYSNKRKGMKRQKSSFCLDQIQVCALPPTDVHLLRSKSESNEDEIYMKSAALLQQCMTCQSCKAHGRHFHWWKKKKNKQNCRVLSDSQQL